MKRSLLLCVRFAPVATSAMAALGLRAAALEVTQQYFTAVDIGAPSVFVVSFSVPLPPVTGLVQVTTSIIGLFADGERDGASIGLVSPTLLSGDLVEPNLTKHPSIGTGGAASFAGAGGTVGKVVVFGSALSIPGAPLVVVLNKTEQFTPSTSRATSSQMHVGGAAMDFSGDGATLTGLYPNGLMAEFSVDNTAHTQLGPSFSAVGLTGSVLDGASASVPGLLLENKIDFQLGLSGGGDTFAVMGRQEIGGDAINGTVLQVYPLSTSTEIVDAGQVGAVSAQMTMAFQGSGGGDTYAFLLRQEITSVPESGGLLASAAGLLCLIGLRYRSRASRMAKS